MIRIQADGIKFYLFVGFNFLFFFSAFFERKRYQRTFIVSLARNILRIRCLQNLILLSAEKANEIPSSPFFQRKGKLKPF